MRDLVRVLMIAFAIAAVVVYLDRLGLEWDTHYLIEHETNGMLSCIREGRFAGCFEAGQFPLLQKIPALALKALGAKDGFVWRFLACLSLAAFVALARNGARSLARQSAALAAAFLAILALSPMLWYARSSFSEMLAASLILATVVAYREDRGTGQKVSAFVLASLSKDIAVPILLALAVLAAPRRARRDAAVLAGSAALALAIQVAFNYFRFRGPWNLAYMKDAAIVPPLGTQAGFFAAQFLSPAGGILFFWPALALTAILAFWAAGRGSRLRMGLLALPIVGFSAGLSRWFSPFGWQAWGSRFLIPWLPATAYLFLARHGKELGRGARMLDRRPAARTAVLVALIALAFVQFHALFGNAAMRVIFSADFACPDGLTAQGDPARYFACIDHRLWAWPPALVSAFSPVAEPGAFLLSAWLAVCTGFVLIPRAWRPIKNF